MTDDVDDLGTDDALLDGLLDARPPRDDEEARAREPYERVIAQLEVRPADGWIDRVEARARQALERERRRRRLVYAGIGAGVLAAAAIALLVLRTPGPDAAGERVAVRVVSPQGTVRRGTTAVGDVLRVAVPTRAPVTVVRIYHQGRLVLACPGADGCGAEPGAVTAAVTLAAAGTYQIVIARGPTGVASAAGAGANLDGDVLSLRKAGAEVELLDRIVVSP